MIILNTEKGIVRIELWQDILDRPGFRPKIDPAQEKLKTVLGSYELRHEVNCGLLPCNQPHLKGYLVECESGIETNIGNLCGKNHFGVDFEEMRRRFDRDVKRKTDAETIQAFQARLPAIREELQQLREGPRGANWARKASQTLVEPLKGLDAGLVKRLGEMIKRGSGDVVVRRQATPQEQRAAELEAGHKLPPRYVEEKVGSIAGLGFFSPDLDLRKLIVEDIEPMLDSIAEIDVQQAVPKDLAAASHWASDYEGKLAAIRRAIQLAIQLLTRANLAPLSRLVETPAGGKRLRQFLAQLPA